MKSITNSEKKNIVKLKLNVEKARVDSEKKQKEADEAHKKHIRALIALSNAKGKVAPLSIQENKIYDLLRKLHYEEHGEITRWWCFHCKTKPIDQEEV